MPAKQIEVTGIGLVSIYKRRDAKSIKLTIQPTGGVRVTMPTWLPYRAGLEYVKSKADWINQHQKTQILMLDGKKIGKYHRLKFVPAHVESITSRVTDTEVRIAYPASLSSRDPDVQAKAVAACEKALRQEAAKLLPQRLDQLASKFGYDYSGVSIKKLKSRWGSCNHQQHISLSLFLMLLPWQLIDYVLLHELNHTKHLNHSASFWAEIENHMPNAKQLRKELRIHQPTL